MFSKAKTNMESNYGLGYESSFFNKGTFFTENFTHTRSFYHQHSDHPNYIATFGFERRQGSCTSIALKGLPNSTYLLLWKTQIKINRPNFAIPLNPKTEL